MDDLAGISPELTAKVLALEEVRAAASVLVTELGRGDALRAA